MVEEKHIEDLNQEEDPVSQDIDDGEEGGEGGMPDMAEMMKMMGGGKGGGKGEDGKPDMSALMSMLGGGMGGGMPGMGGDGGEGGGMGDMASMMQMLGGAGGMGGKGGMGGGMPGMGGKGMGKGQQPPKEDDTEKQCDGYSWQQKGEEVQIRLDKEGLTKKDIKVVFKRFALTVELAGEVVIDGKLYGGIDVDECVWSIDPDTKQCQVMLTKQDEKEEWKSLMA